MSICVLYVHRERDRDRDWTASEQGPPGTDPDGVIEVSPVC